MVDQEIIIRHIEVVAAAALVLLALAVVTTLEMVESVYLRQSVALPSSMLVVAVAVAAQ